MESRVVRGRDLNDWDGSARAMLAAQDWVRLDPLLTELMTADEDYAYYSLLPPQSTWHELAARAYLARGWRLMAAAALVRWLELPDIDKVPGRTRKIMDRVTRIRAQMERN